MPTGPVRDGDDWVRPVDWLPMPGITSGNEKIVGVVAVNNFESNWVSVRLSGDYTVDWGDGTTSNHAAASIASKNLAWSDISSSTLTSDGYRQAIVQITPQSGQQLTSVELAVAPTTATNLQLVNWLDVAVALPNASVFRIGSATSVNATGAVLLERFQWIGPSSSLTDVAGLFNRSTRLRSVNLFDTSNVTTMARMFQGCAALTYVPLFDTGNCTSMNSMFYECAALTEVPFFDTENVLDMSLMFYDSSIERLPLFDTSKVTNMSAFVSYSQRVRTIPLYDTRNVTSMQGMVNQNANLTYIPDFDTRSVTNYTNMLNNMPGIVRMDMIPARSLTIGPFTNLSPSELDRVYTRLPSLLAWTVTDAAGNGTTVTYTTSADHGYRPGMVISMTGISPSAYNLATQTITSCPTPTTFTIANAAVGAYVSGGTATPAGATLNVSANWGVVSDTPSIATAKGWTVTG